MLNKAKTVLDDELLTYATNNIIKKLKKTGHRSYSFSRDRF